MSPAITDRRQRPLAGRHAVVTGAARGIGAAIARRLADDGASLTLMGRHLDTLNTLIEAMPPATDCRAVVCDVTDADSVAAAMAMALERAPVQILVNNAGQAASAPLATTSDALWQQMLAVNLTGTFHCTRAVLQTMLASGWGRIINIASTAGQRGYAYVGAYAAAKHGVLGLTRSLALEVAHRGITVNAVCPGFTDTDLLDESVANIVAKTGRSREQAVAELTRHNPQRRLVQPREVADSVAWLCSDQASAINGQSISVSGGEVM